MTDAPWLRLFISAPHISWQRFNSTNLILRRWRRDPQVLFMTDTDLMLGRFSECQLIHVSPWLQKPSFHRGMRVAWDSSRLKPASPNSMRQCGVCLCWAKDGDSMPSGIPKRLGWVPSDNWICRRCQREERNVAIVRAALDQYEKRQALHFGFSASK
jgi:hypothetical protein